MNQLKKAQKAAKDRVAAPSKLEEETKDHEKTKKKLAKSEKEVKSLNKKVESLQSEVEKQKHALAQEKSQRQDLETTLQELQEEKKELEDRLAALEEKFKEEVEAQKAAEEAALREQEAKEQEEAREAMEAMHLGEAKKTKALSDSAAIYKATSGLFTDSKALAEAVANNDPDDLQTLKQVYKSQYGKNVVKTVSKKSSGNFRVLLTSLFKTVPEFLADLLEQSLGGLTTDESLLMEVLCPTTNEDIEAIKDAYKRLHGKDLVERVQKKTKGTSEKLLVICLQGKRSTNETPDPTQVQADVDALHAAGEGRMIGTDEKVFLSILGNRSPAEIKAIVEAYPSKSDKGRQLVEAIDRNFSGAVEEGLLAIVAFHTSPAQYFAGAALEAMKGFGCDELGLMRVLLRRRAVDIAEIKAAYQAEFEETLADRIKGEVSGDFRRALLYSIKELP